jgi:hypothetical protein
MCSARATGSIWGWGVGWDFASAMVPYIFNGSELADVQKVKKVAHAEVNTEGREYEEELLELHKSHCTDIHPEARPSKFPLRL